MKSNIQNGPFYLLNYNMYINFATYYDIELEPKSLYFKRANCITTKNLSEAFNKVFNK